jgi:flagellar basal body-associated protein FliL
LAAKAKKIDKKKDSTGKLPVVGETKLGKKLPNKKLLIIIAAGILLIIVVVVVLFLTVFSKGKKEKDYSEMIDMMRIPKMSVSILDDKNSYHTLETRFTVELVGGAREKAGRTTIRNALIYMLEDLNYNRINSDYGYDYVKDTAYQTLLDYYAPEDILGVYLTDIICDGTLPASDKDTQNDVFDSIFKED